MATAKRHHYVPRFVLERFTNDSGLLAVYDRERDAVRWQQPINTAVIQHYYRRTDADGTSSTAIEQGLGLIESDAKPIIEKLDRRESLTHDERDALAIFVATLHTRSPEFARGSNDLLKGMMPHLIAERFPTVDALADAMRAHERETGRMLETDPARLFETLHRSTLQFEATPEGRLRLMLSTAEQLAPLLLTLDWLVVHAPCEEPFVLADNPMHIIPHPDTPAGVGTGVVTPGAQKWVPLGPRIGVLIGDPGEMIAHVDLGMSDVRELNLETTARAEDYAFSCNEALLRTLVAETGLASRKKQPLITVT